MDCRLMNALGLKMELVAVIWSNEKPEEGLHFKEDHRFGCVASMMLAASKGRTAYFNRRSFGCPGGGTGLGFGDCYGAFPIESLLSTGNREWAEKMGRPGSYMAEGERFYKNPGAARKWVDSLPMRDIPAEYVVFKPIGRVSDHEDVRLVIFFANGDQLSALVVLADYNRGANAAAVAPFGAACQSILFAYTEAEKETPRGVIGFFDIAQRKTVDRETLSFTVPYSMFREMESNIEGSFLEMETWRHLLERQ